MVNSIISSVFPYRESSNRKIRAFNKIREKLIGMAALMTSNQKVAITLLAHPARIYRLNTMKADTILVNSMVSGIASTNAEKRNNVINIFSFLDDTNRST